MGVWRSGLNTTQDLCTHVSFSCFVFVFFYKCTFPGIGSAGSQVNVLNVFVNNFFLINRVMYWYNALPKY